MRLGYVIITEQGALDPVMEDLAERLRARGLRVAGVVQEHRDRPDRAACDLELRVLPDGPVMPISLDLGPNSDACRLDVGALEGVALRVAQDLPGADLLLVNRFGKMEAEGRGFIATIAEALGADTPVLIGVARPWLAAFQAFSAGLETELPADAGALADWVQAGLAPPEPKDLAQRLRTTVRGRHRHP